ncbi:heat shock protein Hsp90 [Nitzschia inconspicua]|uniref:Heat shock protein Hsp90 n=1 Tax=Nitzschia inconspicua TaxID=303405 RepID=A0A9K3Q1X4_9STRA|nr:heat shock protein Hsp90 [Nitzschia inconspicua]
MKFSPSAVLALTSGAFLASTTAFLVPTTTHKAFGVVKPTSSRPIAATASFPRSTLLSSTTADKTEATSETYEFTSDVGRVMDLIINSLYSDRDIFLRELVSNAADACDKKRFLSITDDAAAKEEPNIRIKANADDNTLIIEDAGVGMTKDELINNLGKIAQSGTRAFVQALGEGTADVNLIGQFGVGFYSAYLVADKVTVITKSMQDPNKAYQWESEADSSYSIKEVSPDEIEASSGTKLILHLKEDASTYLDATKIQELLQRYSEFIEFPISVWKEKTEYKQVEDEEANKNLKEGEEPKMKTVPETTEGYETVNNQKPIWLRPPKEVNEDEYKDFYKSAFRNSYDIPMKYTHFVLEGQVECKAILYIPGMLPFELSKDMFDENSRNIRLYVKRVFINDQFDDLLPRWLKFVKGVVDSNDLPLNVSREILQKSKVLSIINKRLVRKSLDMIREIAETEDQSQYIMFWNNFGKYLKVGIIEDDKNRKEIAEYLRFFSASSGDEYTSLDKYIENMPEGQKAIYYVTGDGKERAAMSPVIEKLKSRGYDVLFATEPLDEIMFESLRTFKDFDVMDAAKDTLKLDEDDEEAAKRKEELNRENVDVINYLETVLSGKVEKVSVSDLLTDSPAALVQGAYGMSPSMQRYMRAQNVASGVDVSALNSMNKVCMEINPKHPIIKDLNRMIKEDKESKSTEDFAKLLFDVAGMTSGYDIDDMSSFAQRVMKLMSTQEDDGTVPEAEVVAEKKEDPEEEPTAAEVEVIE